MKQNILKKLNQTIWYFLERLASHTKYLRFFSINALILRRFLYKKQYSSVCICSAEAFICPPYKRKVTTELKNFTSTSNELFFVDFNVARDRPRWSNLNFQNEVVVVLKFPKIWHIINQWKSSRGCRWQIL